MRPRAGTDRPSSLLRIETDHLTQSHKAFYSDKEGPRSPESLEAG